MTIELDCKCGWLGTSATAGYDDYDNEFRCPACGSGADHLRLAFVDPNDPLYLPQAPRPPREVIVLRMTGQDAPQMTVSIWHKASARFYPNPSPESIKRLSTLLWHWQAENRAKVTHTPGAPGWYAKIH